MIFYYKMDLPEEDKAVYLMADGMHLRIAVVDDITGKCTTSIATNTYNEKNLPDKHRMLDKIEDALCVPYLTYKVPRISRCTELEFLTAKYSPHNARAGL